MRDLRDGTPLPSPPDAVARKVKLLVGREVVRAYAVRPVADPPACSRCRGDGCVWCGWSGEPSGRDDE